MFFPKITHCCLLPPLHVARRNKVIYVHCFELLRKAALSKCMILIIAIFLLPRRQAEFIFHVSSKVIFPAAASSGKMVLNEPYKSLVLKYSLGKMLVSLFIAWEGTILMFVSWNNGALVGQAWESSPPSGNRAVEDTIGMENQNPWKSCPPSHYLHVTMWQEIPFLGVMKHKCSCLKKTDQGSCSQAATSLTVLETHLKYHSQHWQNTMMMMIATIYQKPGPSGDELNNLCALSHLI